MGARNHKEKRGFPAAGIWVLLLLVCFAELFFSAWCRVQHVRVGYDLTRARAENQHLLSLQRQLNIELSRLRSPERIAAIANGQLGLNVPAPEQMVNLP